MFQVFSSKLHATKKFSAFENSAITSIFLYLVEKDQCQKGLFAKVEIF